MGFWHTTKKAAGHIVNVRADQWFDLDGLKTSLRKTYLSAKELVLPENQGYEETFEEALKRLGLTENQLQQREVSFARLFLAYLLLGISVLCYSIVILVLYHNYFGFAMGLALTLYALTRTFYYHFWLFQIRQKKLGCSLREWWNFSSHHSSPPTRKN